MTPSLVVLDLDGTVLDVAPRYRRLHRDVVARHGGVPLDPAEYWRAKRDAVPEPEILARAGLGGAAAAAAETARQRALEERRYLRLDRPWPWTEAALDALGLLAPLVLVTLRRHADRLAWQLERLALHGRFARLVSGPGDGTPECKARLLREAGAADVRDAVVVGDTEVDVASGRAVGALTVALGCGIRSPARLAACRPDLLLDDLGQVAARLRQWNGR